MKFIYILCSTLVLSFSCYSQRLQLHAENIRIDRGKTTNEGNQNLDIQVNSIFEITPKFSFFQLPKDRQLGWFASVGHSLGSYSTDRIRVNKISSDSTTLQLQRKSQTAYTEFGVFKEWGFNNVSFLSNLGLALNFTYSDIGKRVNRNPQTSVNTLNETVIEEYHPQIIYFGIQSYNMIYYYPMAYLAIGIGFRTSLMMNSKIGSLKETTTITESNSLITKLDSETKYKGDFSSNLTMQPILSVSYKFLNKK